MKIGVFDSGVGGESFVGPIRSRIPDAEVIYKTDKDNIPYGNKTPEELLELTLPIFKQFEQEGCQAVLVACNSVTTNIINGLRDNLSIPLVGVEPMVKPGAEMSGTGVIAVCATPATLDSERYAQLKRDYGHDVKIVEPDCSDWANLIENNRQDEIELEEMVSMLSDTNVDVIVLGCTHYHWIQQDLRRLVGERMRVIQPIHPVLDQLERVITES